MTRIGVIADVHANVAALEAGLHVMADEGVDLVACAGDLVGYGPDPDLAVQIALRNCDAVVAGNHDLMAIGELTTDRCVPIARMAMEWTRGTISDATRACLADLPLQAVVGDAVITHGGLGDPERYVLTPQEHQVELDALATRYPEARLLVVGHTHRVSLVAEGPETVAVDHAHAAHIEAGRRYVLNPGSLGQSRARDAITSLAIVDAGAEQVTVLPISVDDAALRRRLRDRGLPEGALHLRSSLASRARRLVGGYARGLMERASTTS
jgi:predicted phosphodiesterase